MQIHISQTTKDHLEHEPYIIEERGKIFVKVSGWKLHVWPYSVTKMTKKRLSVQNQTGILMKWLHKQHVSNTLLSCRITG